MIRVLGKRIIVKADEGEELSAGGLYIPDAAVEKPAEGEIIGVGTEVDDVKIGDHVYYGKYSGTEITVDEDEYLIMDIIDILAIAIPAEGGQYE